MSEMSDGPRVRKRRTAQARSEQRVTSSNKLTSAVVLVAVIIVVVLAGFLVVMSMNGSGPKTTTQVNGAPKLQVDREMIEFGDVKLGKTVEAIFVLSNVGDKLLQITEKPYIEVLEGC